jgi:hypothetical protein
MMEFRGVWKRLSGTESGRKENMSKRFLFGGLVLALALFAYVGYHSYGARRSGVSGDVFSNDPPRSTGKTDSSAKTATGTAVVPEDKSSDSDGERLSIRRP